jgi:succinate dehydrogenase / fumarate reductase flavoprotein subunit
MHNSPAMAVQTRATDVLVVGSGGAGLRAALAAQEGGGDVVLIGKRGGGDAHTVLAAGGINAALGTRDPEDCWEQHFADTFRESYSLAHPRVVEIMAREAPAAVMELADWGCAFARTEDGRLDQRYFGAHTYRRTCYAGDQTGKEIMRTLGARVAAAGIPILERQHVFSLLVHDGECVGAMSVDSHSGARTALLAGAVILCTGGHTSLWLRNTSRADENWGEGMALALRAGCRLMDMELVQFHPTGMVAPEDIAGTLVTEAVRGEGGRLFNATGERFMERYDPERLELSTRDRVALANYTEILEGRGGPNGGVYLDISHRGREYIEEKLPQMYRQFLSFQGLDISKEPMEVAPTAHYSMGGIAVEPESHGTGVPGLFAAGECASGLHGANRLGGNSLVDILVFGRRAGQAAARHANPGVARARPERAIGNALDELDALAGAGQESPRDVQRELHRTMWELCGVVRDDHGLGSALARVDDLEAAAQDVNVSGGPADLSRTLDLRSGLVTARATIRCAIERRETRGAHNRSDFPALDQGFELNFYARQDGEELIVDSRPVPPVPSELEGWSSGDPMCPGPERLLE